MRRLCHKRCARPGTRSLTLSVVGDISHDIDGCCSPDEVIGRVAAQQWGVVALRQLRALGVGRGAIELRLAAGRLLRLHRGVYAVGHAQLKIEGVWLAAVLACGEGAALALRCAAALWDFHWIPSGRAEVLVPRGRRGPSTVRVYRARYTEATTHEGIRVTTPLRTLHDLKRILSLDALERAAARAATRGLVTDEDADAIVGRRPQLTRTRQERRFLAAMRSAGLPEPETNVWLTHGGGEEWQADALFRAERVIVELDGASHRSAHAFELDRYKDAVRQADGYATLRVTERAHLPSVISALRRVLNSRQAYVAR
jgi:hypothetical protein